MFYYKYRAVKLLEWDIVSAGSAVFNERSIAVNKALQVLVVNTRTWSVFV